jgi:hypothetical protein
LTTDITNLPLTALDKTFEELPSSRIIQGNESISQSFINPVIDNAKIIKREQAPQSNNSTYGIKVAHRLLN